LALFFTYNTLNFIESTNTLIFVKKDGCFLWVHTELSNIEQIIFRLWTADVTAFHYV